MPTSPEELKFWEDRYATPDYAFGTAPSYFLAQCKPLLPKSGTALAVADGEGRNGVWLAEQGLTVTAVDFSPSALNKARALAAQRKVNVTFIEADVHTWPYPDAAFDVVAEVFTQFSTPPDRTLKWAGMRRALKPGGLLILQGYSPKQLEYRTGGPGVLDQLYTRAMLEEAFGDFRDLKIVEEERELNEGRSHAGISAVINLTGWKR
ncbi:MAG TPA: class I SAM-dependent methyltransferase [Xanthobacteraceae bacterium]|nr:class I SAM-dependent methyltransferase [Xanthobacteraceae bacterium]